MSLKEKISQDMKTALKAKDQTTLRALRSLKAEIMKLETSEAKAGQALTEDEDMKILMKAAKQRKDSVEQFQKSGREDLAQKEMEELAVFEKYLPAKLTPEEIEAQVKGIIEKTGASSMKDMGKVMGMASKAMAGQADGKDISAIVKKLLA